MLNFGLGLFASYCTDERKLLYLDSFSKNSALGENNFGKKIPMISCK